MRHVDPDAAWDDEEYTRPAADERASWRTGRSLDLAFCGFTLVVAAAIVWSSTTPGTEMSAAVAALLGMLLVGLGWLVLGAASALNAARGRPLPAPWALGLVPLILVVAIVVSLTSLPMRARFAFGRGALEDYATRVADEAGASADVPISQIPRGSEEWDLLHPDPPGRLGGYTVSSVEVRADGVYLGVEEGWSGFAWLPDGPPSSGVVSGSYRSLGGDWYAFDPSS